MNSHVDSVVDVQEISLHVREVEEISGNEIKIITVESRLSRSLWTIVF